MVFKNTNLAWLDKRQRDSIQQKDRDSYWVTQSNFQIKIFWSIVPSDDDQTS